MLFSDLDNISISYDNFVFTLVIAEEHDDIAKTKTDGARNTSRHMMRSIVNSQII